MLRNKNEGGHTVYDSKLSFCNCSKASTSSSPGSPNVNPLSIAFVITRSRSDRRLGFRVRYRSIDFFGSNFHPLRSNHDLISGPPVPLSSGRPGNIRGNIEPSCISDFSGGGCACRNDSLTLSVRCWSALECKADPIPLFWYSG